MKIIKVLLLKLYDFYEKLRINRFDLSSFDGKQMKPKIYFIRFML